MHEKRIIVLTALLLCLLQTAFAQQDEGDNAARRDAERDLEQAAEEMQRATREVERVMQESAVEREQAVADIEIEMREAESRLADAARRVAELSTHRLPGRVWTTEFGGKPVLGVTIDARDGNGPVDGVAVTGVSPGGAAAEAGLRAGDLLTSVNGESLAAGSVREANRRLLDFMDGVEEGDVLEVEYQRNGATASVSLEPRSAERFFGFDGHDFSITVPPVAPPVPGVPAAAFNRYVFIDDGAGLGDLEMVSLTEDLGRYFGTAEGLLVVRAPEDGETFKLQDGDVILDIDGRQPKSVAHAVRILASYQAGETLEIRIMRDQRERTLEIAMPDRRTGAGLQSPPAPPPAIGEPPAAPAADSA